MPWNVTVDFADSRPRAEARVPGDGTLGTAVEYALHQAGISHARSNDVIDGDRTGGVQITVTPCE